MFASATGGRRYGGGRAGNVEPFEKQSKPGNVESDLGGTREVWEGVGAREVRVNRRGRRV